MTMITAPTWLTALQASGFEPYIATSRKLLPFLNTQPFGQPVRSYVMDNPDDAPFLEAYLLSNSLGFESPHLKMPHWVLIDCVLMQTTVVGFTISTDAAPAELLAYYQDDPNVAVDRLDRLPISGQISASAIDNQSLTGISLFSLGRQLPGSPRLGLYTKALALEVLKPFNCQMFYGIAQYDNASLRVHGCFGPEMEISQPLVLLHPRKEMTFIYKMRLDYDPHDLERPAPQRQPDFWLAADDTAQKYRMQDNLEQGKRYIIAPPFWTQQDGLTKLPIIEMDAL